MRWIGLTYSLPSGSSSSPRVAIWRRLRQLGAASPTGSVYLLPWGEENREAFEWLSQEIEAAGGQALVLPIDRLDGSAEERLIELFRSARAEEYRKIMAEADEAAQAGRAGAGREDRSELRDRLEKLRRHFAEVARIDFFQAPEGAEAAAALARLETGLGHGESPAREIPPADLARYRGRRWVTRPRPHVDRLASAWLIRRFVDPEAGIRYSETPEPGEVSFDMRDAEFGHQGNLCTFETLIASFGLAGDPALPALAEIVHEIDLRDGLSARPEIPGIDGLLRGWGSAGWSDSELERHGTALFEGLYLALRQAPSSGPKDSAADRRRGGTRRSTRGRGAPEKEPE
ncbi:MAG TPA: chromate resistance protein ChrB domain-containing protein [Thermoanaerobaculia bacterium]|nr:chromate resistance protein ChrB domain-containing protein [Thermoanaerobaculia bacterium]